jgi:glycosyltransferase involved in cell wall biosynthesis
MACGCPVVATAVSGTLDVVEDGVNGLLVPPKQPRRIAEAVQRILVNESLQSQLSMMARKTIEEQYTWNTISDSYLKIYEELV